MKTGKNKWLLIMVFGLVSLFPLVGSAQSQEAQQLLINVEKLSQLKNILSDMKRGYETLSKGYNSVKNIAQGNFSLHEVFLDGLWLVGPEVRKYHKVAQIVSDQASLVSEYKAAFKRFSGSGVFSASELAYLADVYEGLFKASLDNLDQLLMVVTANKLRMDDQQRLEAIDRIALDAADQLVFLRSFNRRTSLMGLQRDKALKEIKGLGNYFKAN